MRLSPAKQITQQVAFNRCSWASAVIMAAQNSSHTSHSTSKWMHREQQVQQLQMLLSLPQPPDILVFGPSCTLKTTIVRYDQHVVCLKRHHRSVVLHTHTPKQLSAAVPCYPVRRHAVQNLPHAYVSCCRTLKLRSLLSSVVGQLTHGGKRKRAQAFAAAAGTEHSLVWELKGKEVMVLCCDRLCPRHALIVH